MVKQLSQLIELAKAKDSVTVAVAQAADKEVLEAVVNAQKEGIAKALLTGDTEKISAILTEMGENPADFTVIQASSDEECAFKAVEQVRLGNANILMKGLLSTGTFMKAVINRDTGLRTGKTISHTMFYEAPSYGKLLCLTDGGMNTFPDLAKKADILENAIEVVKKLGIEKPTVACVCGAENVDPKVQSTLDADELSKMERFNDAIVYGPVGLDLAISKEAVHHKGYKNENAGYADILLVPTYEVGNGIGKAMTYFAGAKSAGIVVGAKAPIVLVSRSDNAETKLLSIALAAMM
ncbi:MAG: bifunctional enoyl-CoA hydratase/phosphate acetyltransferase [Ruminococcaceae bacterium]|nr:bifunctional enoyl-CoA hydratase/phosphate acetyltransferase [Oscillospiraceae bacterium]